MDAAFSVRLEGQRALVAPFLGLFLEVLAVQIVSFWVILGDLISSPVAGVPGCAWTLRRISVTSGTPGMFAIPPVVAAVRASVYRNEA